MCWGALRSSDSLCLRVCTEEHVLGVINLLNSLDKMWVSRYHCFIVWWHVSGFCCMVLLLGFVVKQTCFLEWSLTYSGSVTPILFFFIITRVSWGINYLITYFVSLLCPYQYHKLEFNMNNSSKYMVIKDRYGKVHIFQVMTLLPEIVLNL